MPTFEAERGGLLWDATAVPNAFFCEYMPAAPDSHVKVYLYGLMCAHGGVQETLISAHWKLKDALAWVRTQYGRDYAIALYKDCVCAERSFVTTAYCKHCGEPIEVYRPQPLQDEDLLCAKCRGKQPVQLSNAILKSLFDSSDEERLQELTLLELGIPLMHIVEFSPRDGNGESLYLELTGDREEVLPNLPE